jgi:hypothetical protein
MCVKQLSSEIYISYSGFKVEYQKISWNLLHALTSTYGGHCFHSDV